MTTEWRARSRSVAVGITGSDGANYSLAATFCEGRPPDLFDAGVPPRVEGLTVLWLDGDSLAYHAVMECDWSELGWTREALEQLVIQAGECALREKG